MYVVRTYCSVWIILQFEMQNKLNCERIIMAINNNNNNKSSNNERKTISLYIRGTGLEKTQRRTGRKKCRLQRNTTYDDDKAVEESFVHCGEMDEI